MKVNQKKRLKDREKMELKEMKRQKRQQNLLNRVKEQFEEIEQEKQAALDDVPVPEVSENQRVSTVSIAVPGSIMENAQSPELRTYLAGQIARAACVFQVDEVIVFDDCAPHNQGTDRMGSIETSEGATAARRCCIQLARILQYLECPQYLRKFFFPIHNDLKYCGLLNPLDSQHHLRQLSEFVFREGIVTNKPVKMGKGSFVNVGLLNDVRVDAVLDPNVRVTVKLPQGAELKSKKLRAKVVPPSQPRQETGIYWGYTVRIANSLSQVFTKSPYKGGYDLTIGTSDRGTNVHELEAKSLSYRHALVVFGGVLGLEPALESDTKLTVDSVEDLFDEYLNTVPGQGSRTVRTEEAILISMAALGGKLHPVNAPKPFACFDAIPQSKDTGIQQYAFNDKRAKPKKTPEISIPDAPPVVNTNVVDDDMSRFD